MRLLLDTHAFIWWDEDDSRLSDKARRALADPKNSVHLSLDSVWEMQIKLMLGKLTLQASLSELLTDREARNGLMIEQITREDIFALERLPPLHRDPFDRMIVAQAVRGQFEVVTHDDEVGSYGVKVFW
jgi:PIN domain nuclease of toxin-antitoxin system